MKVGNKATYICHLTDEVVARRGLPYTSFEVSFEVVESGAFAYGNQTATIMTESTGAERYFDTRYWHDSFEDLCHHLISDSYGKNVEKYELKEEA